MTDVTRPLSREEYEALRKQLASHELYQRYMHSLTEAAADAILTVATAEPDSVSAAKIQNLQGRYAMLVDLNRKLTEKPNAIKRRVRSANRST